MKTIDILVEELPKRGGWPCGAIGAGFLSGEGSIYFWDEKNDCPSKWTIYIDIEVEDSDEEITSEQYESALAAKNEGWIEWVGGGECPVEKGTLIDVKWRDGRIDNGIQAKVSHGHESPNKRNAISWRHFGMAHDIIAYRLHKPQGAEQVRAAACNAYAAITESDSESDLNERICQGVAPVWNGADLPPIGCFCEITDTDGMLVYGHGESGEVIAHVENTAVIRMSYGLGCFEAGFLRPLRTQAERKRDAVVEQMIKIATIYTTKSLSLDLALNSIYNSIAAGEIPGVKLEDL